MKNLKKKKIIHTTGRFGGKTKKWKDDDDNWEYETEIRNKYQQLCSNINEYYMIIRDQNQNLNKCWTKRTTFLDNTIIFEIFLIKNNQLYKYVKHYQKIDDLTKEMENRITLNSTFNEIKLIKHANCLTKAVINEINTIDEAITKMQLINEQIVNFNNSDNNIDFNMLLNLYKYLTILQKLFDKPKKIIYTTSKKIKKMLINFIKAILLITSSIIGKNMQRVVWINGFSKETYSWENYYTEILLNSENYLITLIDTLINAFFIAAIANWSRNTIWEIINNILCCKKKQKNDKFIIKQLPINILIKYKNKCETLLYEENKLKLINNIPKIIRIANFAKKITEIENYQEFEYHSRFANEIEEINKLQQLTNNKNTNNDINNKQIILLTNNIIDNFTKLKKSILESLTWKKRILYCLNDLFWEFSTFIIAHPLMAGVMVNTIEEKFTIYDLLKYIFKPNIILINTFACYSMRPINYIFKSGLTVMNISTNLCPKIISKQIDRLDKDTKFFIAIILFLTVAIFGNIIKTEASLITKFGFQESSQLLNAKLQKWETWLFFILTTASQMFAFSIATNYKIFNFEILLKKIKYFFQPNIILVEEKLKKLTKNKNVAFFTEQEEQKMENKIIELKNNDDNENLNIITKTKTKHLSIEKNIFNPQLINDEQLTNYDLSFNESQITIHSLTKYNTM